MDGGMGDIPTAITVLCRDGMARKKPVKTAKEAKKILQEYFKNEPVLIGNIKEREWFLKLRLEMKTISYWIL